MRHPSDPSDVPGASGTHFADFDNFTRALKDTGFLNAMWLTLVFVVGSAVVGQNTLGLALAVLMQKATKPVRAVVNGWSSPRGR